MSEIMESKDGMGAAVPKIFCASRRRLEDVPPDAGQNPADRVDGVYDSAWIQQRSRKNSHKGDQLIYVIEGKATCRVSGKECEIKAGDFVTIPAGAPHTLRTGAEKLFAVTVFAPPEA